MKFAMRWAPGVNFVVAGIVATAAQAVGPRHATAPTPEAPGAPAMAPMAPTPPTPRQPPAPALAPLPMLPQLARLRHLLPPKAWYGVSLRCSDCSIRSDEDNGRLLEWRFHSEPEIAGVEPDSPADRAGVEEGDVITHIDGVEITSRDAGRRFGAVNPGDKVKWTIERDGKKQDITVTAAERPEEWSVSAAEEDALHRAERELERAKARLENRRGGNGDALAAERDALADARRQLEDARRALRDASRPRAYMWDGDDVAPIPSPDRADAARRADERARRVRYRGDVGTSHVEVRGSSRVVVTEDDEGNVIIDTPDATIKVAKKK